MRIYRLHADFIAGTISAIATLDIVEDGRIKTVGWSGIISGADALGDAAEFEVSFGSTQALSSNDTRQSISIVSASNNFLTSGGGMSGLNLSVPGLDLTVIAGERIHLHSDVNTGLTGTIQCFLYVADGSGARTRRRRS